MVKLKIIHIVPTFELGGVQTGILYSFEKISKEFDYKILVLTNIDEEWLKNIPATMRENIIKPKSKFLLLSWLIAVLLVRQHKPDIIISSLWKSVLPAVIYKKLNKKVILLSFFHSAKIAHKVEFFFHNILAKNSDATLCDSNATNFFANNTYKLRNVFTVPYVFNLKKTGQQPKRLDDKGIIQLVFFGRLDPVKGLDRAFKFCQLCLNHGIKIKYTLYSELNDYGKQLSLLASGLGISHCIEFRNKVSLRDVTEEMKKYDFLLQFSNHEGMALSVVEAMSSGLVPIVTPVGEIPSYCKNGQNSLLLTHPFDKSLPQLMQRFSDLISNREEYSKFSENAMNAFDSWDTYHDSFIDAVKRISANFKHTVTTG